MSVEENESLSVLEKDSGDGWTLVKRLNGEKGYVPTDYIRIVYYQNEIFFFSNLIKNSYRLKEKI